MCGKCGKFIKLVRQAWGGSGGVSAGGRGRWCAGGDPGVPVPLPRRRLPHAARGVGRHSCNGKWRKGLARCMDAFKRHMHVQSPHSCGILPSETASGSTVGVATRQRRQRQRRERPRGPRRHGHLGVLLVGDACDTMEGSFDAARRLMPRSCCGTLPALPWGGSC